jgi:FkbM family methyltransferase
MKKLVRRALNKVGLDVIRLRNSNNSLASHLSNVLATKAIDCIIDVGANAGQYGAFLRRLGYRGHIVSFEPVTAAFLQLQLRCAPDDKWFCHQVALGNKREEKVMNVYQSTVFSSFLRANAYSKSIWRSLEHVKAEAVSVVTLDEVYHETIAKLGCTNCMLKMDTQGYDKYVFEGCRASLDSILVLQSELSLIPVYDGMDQAYDLLREFHKSNFYISGMYPINRDESMAVIEYDCILVKREQTKSA